MQVAQREEQRRRQQADAQREAHPRRPAHRDRRQRRLAARGRRAFANGADGVGLLRTEFLSRAPRRARRREQRATPTRRSWTPWASAR
ncbi:hypothetical protein P4114_15110 [Pseudomonas aeruginosa]|nr:hypothetical protein [Pseudomonas aeruginosa]